MSYDGDRFDDIIDEAAREYNRAPEAPRAEMWERIQAARARRAATQVMPLHRPDAPGIHTPIMRPDVIPLDSRRRRPLWWAAGLAATLMVGVAIGRLSMQGGNSLGVDSARNAGTVAQVQTPVPESRGVGQTPVAVPPAGGVSGGSSGTQSVATRPRMGSMSRDDSQRAVEATIGSGYQIASERAAERRAENVALPYRLAATEHLAMTEALLVSLRADMKSGRRDTTVATWATNLLGTTRMLIDSPAGKDVQMKKLLEDLELVLAQIARLPAASGDSTDLELIDKAVKERHVLTRLRAIGPRT